MLLGRSAMSMAIRSRARFTPPARSTAETIGNTVVSNRSASFVLFERVCGSQARSPAIHTDCDRLLSPPVEITRSTVSVAVSITDNRPLRKCVT